MDTETLKKQIRTIDLAYNAGLKRKSERTLFVHDGETIPLYENFCFALALFRKKSAESVTEGKSLIERLLPFQTEEGNFPLYLHEYPHCHDFQLRYRIAPILIYLLRLFSPVLGELKGKVERALEKALSKRAEKASFENRYRACVGEPLLPVDNSLFSPAEWTEWLITAQLAGQTHFSIPYDPALQLFMGPACFDVQEKGEPRPNPVEWLLADGDFSPRLMRDHPHQLLSAPLFPITLDPLSVEDSSLRLFWKGIGLVHSLVGPFTFDLPEALTMARGDLYEAALYCNASPETQISVGGQKATTFALGESVWIETPTLKVRIRFELAMGEGEFCGHIFRANRPSQCCRGYEAYDWKIGLRTLRRSGAAQIKVHLSYDS